MTLKQCRTEDKLIIIEIDFTSSLSPLPHRAATLGTVSVRPKKKYFPKLKNLSKIIYDLKPAASEIFFLMKFYIYGFSEYALEALRFFES